MAHGLWTELHYGETRGGRRPRWAWALSETDGGRDRRGTETAMCIRRWMRTQVVGEHEGDVGIRRPRLLTAICQPIGGNE